MANKKSNPLLYLIALVLGVSAILWFAVIDDDKVHFENDREFSFKNIEGIDSIKLIDEKGIKTTLSRSSSNWKVNNNFFARPDRIKHLLNTIQHVATRTPVPTKQRKSVINVIRKNHVKVNIYSGGEITKSYIVGHPTSTQTGTYMIKQLREDTASVPFITYLLGFNGFLTSRYDPEPGAWRDNVIMNYPKLEIKSIQLNYDSDTFRIQFDGENYKFKNYKVQEEYIRRYLLNFKSLAVEYFIEGTGQKQTSNRQPFFEIVITDLENNTTNLKGYRKTAPEGMKDVNGNRSVWDKERFIILVNDNQWAVAQYFVFDPLFINPKHL